MFKPVTVTGQADGKLTQRRLGPPGFTRALVNLNAIEAITPYDPAADGSHAEVVLWWSVDRGTVVAGRLDDFLPLTKPPLGQPPS